MTLDREPIDPLGPFVGLRNLLLGYLFVLMTMAVVTKLAIGQSKCEHPVDMQRIQYDPDGFGLWYPSEELICDVCGKVRSVDLPRVIYDKRYQSAVRMQIEEHQRYVDAVRESGKARELAGTKTKVETMHHGVQYIRPDRTGPQANQYLGATSRGPGWEIRWQGTHNPGPTPIEAMRALLDHLTNLQHSSNAASEANAKLLYHVHTAIEEHDGKAPTIGGHLNDLIPTMPHPRDTQPKS